MKKVVLVIALLFGFIVQGQDLKYIKSLDSLNNESAREFADEVIKNSKTKYEYLRIDETTKEPENYHEIVYVPVDLPNKAKKVQPFVICDECIKVRFYVYSAGENKNLEIKGTRALYFSEVSGRYLDLFPVWERIFKPGVNVEKTIEDYNSRMLKVRNPEIEYRFDKKNNENNWYIHNYS